MGDEDKVKRRSSGSLLAPKTGHSAWHQYKKKGSGDQGTRRRIKWDDDSSMTLMMMTSTQLSLLPCASLHLYFSLISQSGTETHTVITSFIQLD